MRHCVWLAPLLLAGCAALESDLEALKPPTPPRPAEPTAANQALAAKVDQIGRELVEQNPFLGVGPTFALVGRPAPEIYHPDLNGVFVSDGLAARCDDAQLAAVLAMELGKMSAEAKRAKALTRTEPMRQVPTGGGAGLRESDPMQLATQTLVNRQREESGGKAGTGPAADPKAAAVTILQNAGRDVAALDAAASLYSEASRERGTSVQFGARPSAPPEWTR